MRGNGYLPELFYCTRGVRQGPMHFALFLNDSDGYDNEASTGVSLADVKINTLLYADDLILLSGTADGLQAR